MALPKPKPMSGAFAKALEKTATAKVPPKKNGTAEVTDPPAGIASCVDAINVAKAELAAAKAEIEAQGGPILEFFRNLQDENAYAGNYQNSYKIHGNQSTVTVVAANKFSINPEDETEIAAISGEFFDFLFDHAYTVQLKDEVLLDQNKQNELMKLIGNRFADFFTTTVSLKTRDKFTSEVYNILPPEKLEMLRVFVKQAKPSIK